ncbi:hypothetical protein [Devosia sp.]|uniref:hypothetical protein n=1 Tax=Devosia sp. TaxID=1871048 RepID=UPI0032640E56
MARLPMRFGVLLFGLAFAGPASAEVLPIIGVYGNAAGCVAYASGNIDSDDFVFLTPDSFSSYGSGCDFDTLVSAVDGVFTLGGVCSAEGEEGTTMDSVVVSGSSIDGYFVKLEGLDTIGPLKLCPVGLPGEVHI